MCGGTSGDPQPMIRLAPFPEPSKRSSGGLPICLSTHGRSESNLDCSEICPPGDAAGCSTYTKPKFRRCLREPRDRFVCLDGLPRQRPHAV